MRVAYEATLEQNAVGGRHNFKTQYKAHQLNRSGDVHYQCVATTVTFFGKFWILIIFPSIMIITIHHVQYAHFCDDAANEACPDLPCMDAYGSTIALQGMPAIISPAPKPSTS